MGSTVSIVKQRARAPRDATCGALVLVLGCGRLEFTPIVAEAADAATAADGADGSPDAATAAKFVRATTYADPVSQVVSTMSVPGTTPGNLLVLATINSNVGFLAEPISSITDDAGNTYVDIGMQAGWEGMQGLVQLRYVANAMGPVTTVTITSAAVTTRNAWLVEFANIAQVDALAAAAKTEDLLDAPTRQAALVTAPARSVVLSIMMIDGVVTGIHSSSPFMALPNINGDGGAYHVLATEELTGAVWSAPNTTFSSSLTAAFKAR